jgi:hypothetical protein
LTSVVVAASPSALLFETSEYAFINLFAHEGGLSPAEMDARILAGDVHQVFLACWRWWRVNMVYFLSGCRTSPEL